MGEGTPKQEKVAEICTEYYFFDAITDATNQFLAVESCIKEYQELSLQEIKQKIKLKVNPVHLEDYLLLHWKKKFSASLLAHESCAEYLERYNLFIDGIQEVGTLDELKELLKVAKEIFMNPHL